MRPSLPDGCSSMNNSSEPAGPSVAGPRSLSPPIPLKEVLGKPGSVYCARLQSESIIPVHSCSAHSSFCSTLPSFSTSRSEPAHLPIRSPKPTNVPANLRPRSRVEDAVVQGVVVLHAHGPRHIQPVAGEAKHGHLRREASWQGKLASCCLKFSVICR